MGTKVCLPASLRGAVGIGAPAPGPVVTWNKGGENAYFPLVEFLLPAKLSCPA